MPLAWSLVLIFSVLLSISKWSGADALGIVQKPAIILVPAAFSEPSVYDRVKASLSDVGYEVFTVKLPSVGKGSGHVDRTPDIKAVQKTLGQRLHLGRQVILVGNSYGGTVICDAVKDFEKESSVKSRDGKILGLIFFSGFLPYISELSGARPDIRQISPSWFRFEGTRRVFWDNDLVNYPPQHTLYNLLENRQASTYAVNLQPSSFAALNATATYIPYDGKFRSLYVVGSKDNAVPPALAKTYLDQKGAVWETKTIDGDHSPMLSRPDAFVKIVRQFAGEDV